MDDFLSEKVQEHGIARFGKKERACNRLDYRLLLADRVGFEPTSRLRDCLISSQGRYDHFDTLPYDYITIHKFCEKVKKKQAVIALKYLPW